MWKAITDLALEHIVVPLAMLIVNIVGPFLADLVQWILLAFMILPLWVIRFLEDAVDIFSGVGSISTTVTEGGVTTTQTTTLIDYFFGQSVVTTVFWGITLISAALCIGFSIVAVVRSMGDLDVKRPVGKILGSVGKAMLTFLIIPFMCIASISMAGLVLRQVSLLIDTGGQGGEPVSVTGALFIMSATPDTVPEFEWGELNWNIDDGFYFIEVDKWTDAQKQSAYEGLRYDYMTGRRSTGWSDIPEIKETFNVFKLFYPGNAVVSFITSWFYVIMMVLIVMIFLRRLYELILLYLVSPFFVSVIPLDEGEKFKGWREQFISTVIAGFGSIFMLKILTLFLPLIWNDDLRLHHNSFTNLILKALLTAGGIYATYKSHTMISTIVSERGSASERDTSNAFDRRISQMTRSSGGAGAGKKGNKGGGGKSGAKSGGSSGNKNPGLAGMKGTGAIDFSKPLAVGAGISGGSSGSSSGGTTGGESKDKPTFKKDPNILAATKQDIKNGVLTSDVTTSYLELDAEAKKKELETNPFLADALVEESKTNPSLAEILKEDAKTNQSLADAFKEDSKRVTETPVQSNKTDTPDNTVTPDTTTPPPVQQHNPQQPPTQTNKTDTPVKTVTPDTTTPPPPPLPPDKQNTDSNKK